MTEVPTDDEVRKRIENLRAVLAGPGEATRVEAHARTPADSPVRDGRRRSDRRRATAVGGVIAVVTLLLGKLKVIGLLAGVLKLKTLGTMLLSVVVYATEWGLPFSAGFVLLILVHEWGHAIVMQRERIPAGAPVFIPFLGAFIAMRGWPRNAYVEAKVALGGPVVGSLAAWIVLAAGLGLGSPLLLALGHAGVLINLFNLIPVLPLDGGRIAGVFSRGFWAGAYALGGLGLIVTRSPLLLIGLVAGLITFWQRWRDPVPGYRDIPRARRVVVGIAYAALVSALAVTLPLGPDADPGTRP